MTGKAEMIPTTGSAEGKGLQITEFEVDGLFGRYHHRIPFGEQQLPKAGPSLVILYGANGVGKTTVLRMIDGLLRLDFGPFRTVPFNTARLVLSSGQEIRVKAVREQSLERLQVTFGEEIAELHPERSGTLEENDQEAVLGVVRLKEAFFSSIEGLNFELIDTGRILRHQLEEKVSKHLRRHPSRESYFDYVEYMASPAAPRARGRRTTEDMAERVLKFIREAQVNYRRFFTTTEPDLFPKVLRKLGQAQAKPASAEELRGRLATLRDLDIDAKALGLEPENWNYQEVADFLRAEDTPSRDYTHLVLEMYITSMESRADQRKLVVDRLKTFERIMGEFFEGKKVKIDARKGFRIVTQGEATLEESQLSSGELHLLYLMVAALVTQRRGTVIAIDEPEMSMHLKWQRRLIGGLMECAANAEPQFIFASHSPDIAADYRDCLLELK